MIEQEKILLTGGQGFIGANLVERFSEAGIDFLATSRHIPIKSTSDVGYCFLEMDDYSSWRQLPNDITTVVHAASVLDESEANRSFVSNVKGSMHLARFAEERNIKKIINLSTVSVYGFVEQSILTCSSPINNPANYGATKYAAEIILNSIKYPTSVISLRLPGVLGPNAHRAWLPNLAKAIINNKKVKIFNATKPFNNCIHTDSLFEFIVEILSSDRAIRSVFPLGTRWHLTTKEVVYILANELGRDNLTLEEIENQHASNFIIKNGLMSKELGYKPWTTECTIRRFARDLKFSLKG